MIECGDTSVLVTATRSSGREGIDFLPLICDYEERLYAAGRIPGSFMRREGRPPERAAALRRTVGMMANRVMNDDGDSPLTPRESQVLTQIAHGLSNKEIAEVLAISVETVKEHVQNLLRKLAVNDRTQAAVWAIRQGLA